MDVAANSVVIKEVKKNTTLPLCVSSISLNDLYYSAIAGADLLEIGNYDFFYQQGIFLSKEQILNLSKEALKVFPGLDICVTIPYTLSLKEQIQLSCQLEEIGISILQTESLKVKSVLKYSSLTELINIATPVLSSTYTVSSAVKIPVIAASGVNSLVSSLAILYGASGIGIGSSVMDCIMSLEKCCSIQKIINVMKVDNKLSSFSFVSSIQDHSKLLT